MLESRKEHIVMSEWLKSLSNQAEIPIVLMEPSVCKPIYFDEQWQTGFHMELPRWEFSDEFGIFTYFRDVAALKGVQLGGKEIAEKSSLVVAVNWRRLNHCPVCRLATRTGVDCSPARLYKK